MKFGIEHHLRTSFSTSERVHSLLSDLKELCNLPFIVSVSNLRKYCFWRKVIVRQSNSVQEGVILSSVTGDTENFERGSLLYSSPKNSKTRLALSLVPWGLLWFVGFVILIPLVSGSPSGIAPSDWVFLAFFLFLAFVLIPMILSDRILHRHFGVYTKGVTKQISHFFKFKRGGDFIPYPKMEAFECSSDGERCVIYLRQGEPPAHYWDGRITPITMLEEHLVRTGVKEVPIDCPKCWENLFLRGRTCPRCGERRF